VVAVVAKRFAGREPRRLAHDAVAFEHGTAAVFVLEHPLTREQFHRAVGGVLQRDEVDKGVRFICGQAHPAVVIAELIEAGCEAGDFAGTGKGHSA